MWPVELGREETRRGVEDLICLLQLGVLLLQRLDLRGLSLDATAFIAAHSVS